MSVYGTDTSGPSIEAFLVSAIRVSLWAKPSHLRLDVNGEVDLPASPAYALRARNPSRA